MVSPAGSRLAKPTTASRLPPVHALSAFEAAARLNSFALAADELCITPSALSHRIRLLEDFVGERLFIRDGRSFALSEFGRRYLDVVRSALRDSGHTVTYVQNITDVDDPLLERAERDGIDWRDLATREIDLFREDMTALAVIPPDLPLVAHPREVESWFEAPLALVMDERNWTQGEVFWKGAMRRFYEMDYSGYRIWGVTAAICANLSRRLAWRSA